MIFRLHQQLEGEQIGNAFDSQYRCTAVNAAAAAAVVDAHRNEIGLIPVDLFYWYLIFSQRIIHPQIIRRKLAGLSDGLTIQKQLIDIIDFIESQNKAAVFLCFAFQRRGDDGACAVPGISIITRVALTLPKFPGSDRLPL